MAKSPSKRPLRIDPDKVFDSIQKDRDAGTLSAKCTNALSVYEASGAHKGHIERVYQNGLREIGLFVHGKFFVKKDRGR